MEESSVRYHVSPVRCSGMAIYPVFDGLAQRFIAACEFLSDSELIVGALNATLTPALSQRERVMNARLRPLMAMEIADFRMKLEHENGGPLQDAVGIALLLSDLCDFLKFNTGERALALGRDFLVLLCRLESEEPPAAELFVI